MAGTAAISRAPFLRYSRYTTGNRLRRAGASRVRCLRDTNRCREPRRYHAAALVVEDGPLVRMDASDFLMDQGFEVIEAENADQAILVLEADSRIRLVFTDVDMPGTMDGLKLARVVADRWPPIRIIITSGHRLVEITDIPDGSLFFSKPYQQASIVSAMREFLA